MLRIIKDDIKSFLAKGVNDYPVEGIVVPDGFRLVQEKYPVMHDGFPMIRIRLIDIRTDGTPIVVYAINLMLRNDIFLEQYHCTQVLVWRTPQPRYKAVLRDFATIMFDHFCENYIVIASDTSQTNDGRRFWESRILEAFDSGRFVYFIDHNEIDENMIPHLTSLTNEAAFSKTWLDHGWDEGDEYKDRLFLISPTNLKN